ncbi:Protein of unknown function [Duganella sp. CF402]|nr:uncharacterized protein DUF3800 [Duganella sp. BK701]SEM41431.1 Protein of unknown function [Duganella sp. CF402]
MHLLYVDESGATTDASQRYFVLAGVSVFERTTHWIEKSLDDIAARIAPDFPNELEFHGSPMRSGKGVWRKIASPEQRESLIVEALRVGVVGQPKGVRLFACVVEKTALVGKDPVHVCFEQLARRFDLFLQRCHTKFNDHQRGLMLFDESSTEQRFQTLAREFKHRGHSYGKTRNYVEVPVFLDSRASRLIQLADLVAFAIFPHFEHGDSKYWDVIKDSFDSEGGVKHGFLLCDHAHPVLKRTLRGRSRLA